MKDDRWFPKTAKNQAELDNQAPAPSASVTLTEINNKEIKTNALEYAKNMQAYHDSDGVNVEQVFYDGADWFREQAQKRRRDSFIAESFSAKSSESRGPLTSGFARRAPELMKNSTQPECLFPNVSAETSHKILDPLSALEAENAALKQKLKVNHKAIISVFEKIEHGDSEHRVWLYQALAEHFAEALAAIEGAGE